MTKSTLALVAALAAAPLTGRSHTFESSDKWAVWTCGRYTISNDVWGENPGPESLWADPGGVWGVTTIQSGKGIKSYPHSEFGRLDTPVDSLGALTSRFSATNPDGCSYDQAYDIWLNGSQYEVMIWNRWEHTQPVARSYHRDGSAVPTYSNVTIAGTDYDVYMGTGGSGACISFLRKTQVDSGSVDLAAVLKWIETTKWYRNPVLTSVQNGWEIISTSGVRRDFVMRTFSVSREPPRTGNSEF
jgi:hypothetical protein